MVGVARQTDTIAHGSETTGTITGGSPDSFADSLAVARLGDPAYCSVHGDVTIVAPVSAVTFADNLGVARLGDAVSCSATITSASPDVLTD